MPAPSFTAVTTQGKLTFPDDYRGHWVIFFSHPSDFTPVCTTEFMRFARLTPEFEALNTKLLALSVDGLYSHIAWIRTIKQNLEWAKMKAMDITFPVIDDTTMSVAKKYGMIQPAQSNSKAVRALFFIDPKGVVRAMIYYPMNVGRSIAEVLRVLTALQTADRFGVSTPADWNPGDDVMVPVEPTTKAAEERVNNTPDGVKCHDWFFCTKELLKEEIDKMLKDLDDKKK
ncbi:MAG: peroxiredoxin [Flavobacteriales bacterium]|nr:peroxiredoxin [Flavobacteriales bacterium]